MAACRATMLLAAAAIATCGGQTAPERDGVAEVATASSRTVPPAYTAVETMTTVGRSAYATENHAPASGQTASSSEKSVSRADPTEDSSSKKLLVFDSIEEKWLKMRLMMERRVLERKTRSGRSEGRDDGVVVVVTEMCYYPINGTYLEGQIEDKNVRFLTYEETCEDYQKVLEILTTGPKMLVGSLRPDLCAPASFLSSFFNSTMLSWNCPAQGGAEAAWGGQQGAAAAAAAPLVEIARAFAAVAAEMKWKSVAIISLETGWYPWLSHQLEVEMRGIGVIPKHFFGFSSENVAREAKKKLGILKKVPCRAVILCAPADSAGLSLLNSLLLLNLHFHNTLLVLLDSFNLQSWRYYFLQTNNLTSSLGDLLIFGDLRTPNDTLETYIIKNIRKGLSRAKSDGIGFFLADVIDKNLRYLQLVRRNTSWWYVEASQENIAKWRDKHVPVEDCDEFCRFSAEKLVGVWVYWVVVSVLLLVFAIMAIVVASKCQVLKKRSSKAPYKVLLAPTDFVFPQIADNLRVDEGIEAMLCCWLQQLQEFGGPEVDKPDLLQGSGTASARTPLRAGSSPNLAKQLVVDPRVRYNGDLVQMKPLPAGSAAGELRAKTVELLSALHGLRHENLNPLIGCLTEPPRAFLVSEYCARGSLQDVLQQDDIKLDWSFRLSLLTDLVRGMKYLHSTQIRVHGYLTSRNCVIDARWVLKVTDYGLPAFYETQGIPPPNKSARELLWTAPELLRHASSRKKGTQAGDVYSFGIILQEVVVRGEPFCMLALTPEEIIEKVKHPPPLIRPSVSKGAAPPEAINIMRQCWAEPAEMRPDFNAVHDQFKKLNHGRKVNIVDTMFQMLEKYSNNLEELIRERTEQLDIEKKKTEQLLNRMLPSYVAEKLKLGMPVDPEEYEEVTIYFSDIVGFTTISAHSTPFQVVDLLNDLYTCFDATINAYDVYKVETIGDAYMVVGGLPVRIPDHAEQVATMALDLLHQSGKFRISHLPGTPLRLRIGLHSGPCCAGVVGLTMPRYCLFGDTVNTASRMESTGAAWRIHLSEDTKNRLEKAGGYKIEFRGPTVIKGKGTMDTYWLLGKEGFNKELPVPPSIELDESLIVCKPLSAVLQEQDSGGDSVSIDSSKHHFSEAGHPKSPNPSIANPSFIKSMEFSKFSSLVKAYAQEESNNMPSGRRPSISDYHMVKSTSSDVPVGLSLGTPVSASEVAAALLGASTSSLCGFRQRHRKIEEEDLSTPYNHYKCLSPKQKIGKLLRRQFSLDRTEENHHRSDDKVSPRLQKQNSAGAADLEKIEEIPLKVPSTSPSSSVSPIQCTFSISVDSLLH